MKPDDQEKELQIVEIEKPKERTFEEMYYDLDKKIDEILEQLRKRKL